MQHARHLYIQTGTVLESHGARYITNAHIGCLKPAKVTRCIDTSIAALTEGLARDEYEANNSFIVHVDDIINLPTASRAGIWAPLKAPGYVVNLGSRDGERGLQWPRANASYVNIIQHVRERPQHRLRRAASARPRAAPTPTPEGDGGSSSSSNGSNTYTDFGDTYNCSSSSKSSSSRSPRGSLTDDSRSDATTDCAHTPTYCAD